MEKVSAVENTMEPVSGAAPEIKAGTAATHRGRCAGDSAVRRAKDAAKKYAVIIAMGLTYFGFVSRTGWSLPCPFHAVTGLECPGCGITRLFLALGHGDFRAAFAANPALFFAGPLLIFLLARDEYYFIRTGHGREMPRWFGIFLLVGFTLFTIWRNLLR